MKTKEWKVDGSSPPSSHCSISLHWRDCFGHTLLVDEKEKQKQYAGPWAEAESAIPRNAF